MTFSYQFLSLRGSGSSSNNYGARRRSRSPPASRRWVAKEDARDSGQGRRLARDGTTSPRRRDPMRREDSDWERRRSMGRWPLPAAFACYQVSTAVLLLPSGHCVGIALGHRCVVMGCFLPMNCRGGHRRLPWSLCMPSNDDGTCKLLLSTPGRRAATCCFRACHQSCCRAAMSCKGRARHAWR